MKQVLRFMVGFFIFAGTLTACRYPSPTPAPDHTENVISASESLCEREWQTVSMYEDPDIPFQFTLPTIWGDVMKKQMSGEMGNLLHVSFYSKFIPWEERRHLPEIWLESADFKAPPGDAYHPCYDCLIGVTDVVKLQKELFAPMQEGDIEVVTINGRNGVLVKYRELLSSEATGVYQVYPERITYIFPRLYPDMHLFISSGPSRACDLEKLVDQITKSTI